MGNFVYKKRLIILILLLLLFVKSIIAFGKVTVITPNRDYLIEEYFVSKQEAKLACMNLATQHHYNGELFCNEHPDKYEIGSLGYPEDGITVPPFISDILPPFDLAIYYFDLTCSSGTQLDQNTGDCRANSIRLRANTGKPGENLCISNPINAATGNKYLEEVDIIFSTGLSFSRYYNSSNFFSDSQMGAGWHHTYQRNLHISPGTILATRSDGKSIYFSLNNSIWTNQQASGEMLIEVVGGNGWLLTTSDDTKEIYDISGKLISIINRNHRTQTLSYDINNRLAKITDDVGRTLNFTYDSFNRIQTLADPSNGVYQYDYDIVSGNLSRITYPDNKTRIYHYNESAYAGSVRNVNALTGITDENGVRFATYTYDAQGRAVVTEHAGGVERYVLGYSADGSNTMVTDPLGSQYTHHFQTILGVAKSTGQSQPAGSGCGAAASNITYDVNGNIASRTDFNGNKTCYAYDLNRNLEIARVEGMASGSTCATDLIGYSPAVGSSERKITTDWHASFRLPILIRENKRETSLTYDTHGNITQYQIKDTATNNTRTWNTSHTYHASKPGVITQRIEDGPRTDITDITTHNYYAPDANCAGGHFGCRGQIATITNALGHVTEITRYNAHGQPEEIYDANDLITTLVYDNRQRAIVKSGV
ncbi:MAG: DUF6531 domain-containing protein [Nitrosomonas sp.]